MRKVVGIFKVDKVIRRGHNQWNEDGKSYVFVEQQDIEMSPVSTNDPIPEAEKFHEATPTGHLQMTISNPAAQGVLEPGEYYRMELTQVNKD